MGVLSDFDNFEFLTSDFDNLVLILLTGHLRLQSGSIEKVA